jgi:hypothetical protein
MRMGARSSLVVAALLGAAACSDVAGGTEPERAVIDETHAYLRGDQHVCYAVASLGMDVRLDPRYRNSVPKKGLFSAQSGLVNVEVRYIPKLPPVQGDVFERNRDVFHRLKEWWERQGYQVVRHEVRGSLTVLHVVDPRDDFTVTLKQGPQGNLWITSSSPWVTATGLKPPEPPGCQAARPSA